MEDTGTLEVSLDQGERFVFVGGAPRSGTTLLQNMLDSHPEILGGPEFLHLREIAELRSRMAASIRNGWITEFCSLEEMDRAVAELIARLLLPLADRHGAALISEKTPKNVFGFEELLGLFPQARAIHVVRDPRAVVASMLEVGRRAERQGVKLQPFTRYVGAAVRYVKECYEAGARAAELAPGRVLTVAYERLVASPEKETRRICDFLGLPWDEAMLRPGEHQHIGLAPITEGNDNLWYDRASYQRNPEPGSHRPVAHLDGSPRQGDRGAGVPRLRAGAALRLPADTPLALAGGVRLRPGLDGGSRHQAAADRIRRGPHVAGLVRGRYLAVPTPNARRARS
jgi:protein-tyrosine sulfotransferase